ncbi:MAG: peptidoglycan editing factor PgeF, partial [Alkaliphilus sp.]|nr:peptidoglycan editing factor PgeF [Alkaliphilus sp.]
SGVDGMVTDVPNIPLMAMFADCVPVFFIDTVKRTIGISHAGWKGTKLRIGEKTVRTMTDIYGSKAEQIIAVIGPSIGKCCYEVNDIVADQLDSGFTDTSTFIFPKGKGKYRVDLWEANRIILNEAGILNKNIIISGLCTGCNLDLFYSYRKEKGNTGRMGAVIQLI